MSSGVAAGGAKLQRVSKAGFDVTPLSAEEKMAEAQKLTDFQK
jgi:hypothetical protein